MLCQRMHVQKGMWGYFLRELFLKSLHPSRHRSGSWGWAVFALHCRVLIGAVCLLLPQWRLLLGQVSEHCCKAVGVLLWQDIIVTAHYCDSVLLDIIDPLNPPCLLLQEPTRWLLYLHPHQSSHSLKCPSPCPWRRWVWDYSNWILQHLPPSR